VGCGVEPAYGKAIRSALLGLDGWDSLLIGKMQAFKYENYACDYPTRAEPDSDEYEETKN
jgi:hypothetical protein